MIEILMMGFLLGIRHALESDHVAAVASLMTNESGIRESILLGSVWGLGHTFTLLLFGSAVLLLDQVIPERMATSLEFAVGLMLVLLGIDVIRRFRRDKIRFLAHSHTDGTTHLHALSHASEHSQATHRHRHPNRFPLRALFVGMMHGMAGSAALIVLALQSVHSFATGLLYIALFGGGSIAGMALLSATIILPLRHCNSRFAGIRQYLQPGIGSLTAILGISIMYGIAMRG